MVPPLTLCSYMKKGPNLRWSLIQCSGGDEGNRTPDLLTASQALSQLSYAPVRTSTIRELGRRCKDNFGKTFAGGARGRPTGPEAPDSARGARPAGGGSAASRLFRVRRAAPGPLDASTAPSRAPPRTARHETGPSTTFGPHPTTMPLLAKTKPQVDDSRILRNPGYGRGAGVKRSRWAGFMAGVISDGCPKALASEIGNPLTTDFQPIAHKHWLATPFRLSFVPWICTYSANPVANKDFARSHQAVQHR